MHLCCSTCQNFVPFSAWPYSSVCTYHLLFTRLSVSGPLGGFHLLTLVNNAAVNVAYQCLFETLLPIILGINVEVELRWWSFILELVSKVMWRTTLPQGISPTVLAPLCSHSPWLFKITGSSGQIITSFKSLWNLTQFKATLWDWVYIRVWDLCIIVFTFYGKPG